MLEKYGSDDESDKVYELATLTANTISSKIYLRRALFFSVQTLQVMRKVRDALREKPHGKKRH